MEPSPHNLPEVLPILPLTRSLLLPGSLVWMQVTDPRHRRLVEDVLAAEDLLGLVQPVDEAPGDPASAELYEVGCLGRIETAEERDGGGYSLLVRGVLRFRRLEELQGADAGYRRLRVDYEAFLSDLDEPWEEADFSAVRDEIRRRIAEHSGTFDTELVDRVKGPDIVNGFSQIFPLSQAERQALLEAPTVHARQDLLLELMRMSSSRPNRETSQAPS